MKIKKLNKINKKASAPTVAEWIPASILICIILVIYFIFLGMTVLSKGRNSSEVSFSEKDSKLLAAKELIKFLETDIGNNEKMYDLLQKAEVKDGKESERAEIFENKGNDFLKTTFPAEKYSSFMVLIKPDELKAIEEGYKKSSIEGYNIIYYESYTKDSAKLYDIKGRASKSESLSADLNIPGNKILHLFVVIK
jgi:hypothetical protein